MKKIALTLVIAAIALSNTFSQKYAYVDTEYILSNIPSYKAAQEKLDEYSKQWQSEIEDFYTDIEKLYKDYQAEKVLLPEEMKQKKEQEILDKEKEAKELQNKYFGREGELFEKRKELVNPIQDEVYNAIKTIATEGNYALIFDTSSSASILFSNPKYDKSDEILEKLGYSN